MIPYSNVLATLFLDVEHVRRYYEDNIDSIYGRNLPRIVYGSMLMPFLQEKLDQFRPKNPDDANPFARDVFQHIENLIENGDEECRNLVETSFLESLRDEHEISGKVRSYFGPGLTQLWSRLR